MIENRDTPNYNMKTLEMIGKKLRESRHTNMKKSRHANNTLTYSNSESKQIQKTFSFDNHEHNIEKVPFAVLVQNVRIRG